MFWQNKKNSIFCECLSILDILRKWLLNGSFYIIVFRGSLGLFSLLNVLIRQNQPSVDSSVFVPSLYELNFNCVNNNNNPSEHNDRLFMTK